jgi:hypothetical protein
MELDQKRVAWVDYAKGFCIVTQPRLFLAKVINRDWRGRDRAARFL